MQDGELAEVTMPEIRSKAEIGKDTTARPFRATGRTPRNHCGGGLTCEWPFRSCAFHRKSRRMVVAPATLEPTGS